MTDISINSGKLLDLIRYNNEASIRGLQDPHSVALSKFIFCDFDIDSFKDLKKYYINSSKIDIFTLYYCLSTFILDDKINSKEIDFDTIFKKVIFSDKNIKKLLNDFITFNKQPSYKNLEKIKNNDINDDELKRLLISLSIKYLDFEFNKLVDLFPIFNHLFEFSDNTITIRNNNALIKAFDDDGLLLLIFVNKYYSFFNYNDLNFILDKLISEGIFDGFLLHLYLLKKYQDNNFENSFFSQYSNHFKYLPNRFILSVAQFVLLNYFFNNDYSSIKTWFNQFTSKINSNELKLDSDGFINWDIEDNNLEPVSYRFSQFNSRFYINSIHHLSAYRDKIIDFYNNDEKKHKINVFGGSHAMSFANFQSNFFYTNVFFHYTDRFLLSNSSDNFIVDKILDSIDLKEKNILIFDYEFFCKNSIKEFLDNLFNNLSNVMNKDKLYFFTTPLPSLYSHRYLDSDNVINTINSFNIELKKKVTEFGFKFVDINSFLNVSSNYINSNDLLCHYYIKPDIIHKIIVDEVLK